MTLSNLSQSIMDKDKFRGIEDEIAIRTLVTDYPSIVRSSDSNTVDWTYALQTASALIMDPSSEAQISSLRLVQGCLLSDASPNSKETALLLLERMGNAPAAALAENRGHVEALNPEEMSLVHHLDILRRRFELTIVGEADNTFQVNPFQRDFWSAAQDAAWISVSAPTSAGKSFIVKQWLKSKIVSGGEFQCVYLVPTRALIEEVSSELRNILDGSARIFTMPWDKKIEGTGNEVFVLTQERLHFLLNSFPELRPQLLFVDEAQKYGDNSRGVLLHRVINDCSLRNPALQVIFATPLAENPEVLLLEAPSNASTKLVEIEAITVTQSVAWAHQQPRHPKDWKISAVVGNRSIDVGDLKLQNSPGADAKRLPLVAFALGSEQTGNVVYVNGAAAAEAAAKVLYDAYGPAGNMPLDSPVFDLIELTRSAVHPNYALATVLKRGIAFHYGNMPQLIRAEIERLLRDGTIRFLVCTSTLLEGVNLPCRTIYARGPKKGSKPMSMADFWNLAGRAGRWGKEFQGTVVCVDTDRDNLWSEVPQIRRKQPIRKAYREALDQYEVLLDYVAAPVFSNPIATQELEYTFNFLCEQIAAGATAALLFGDTLTPQVAERIIAGVRAALESIAIPLEVFARHPGVSPVAMNNLYDQFTSHLGPIGELALASPDSNDAPRNYARALKLIAGNLGGDFVNEKHQTQLAFLITHWMRGWSLSQMIASRWDYELSLERPRTLDTTIRNVMSDIEKYARYEIPKYIHCYQDILFLFANQHGVGDEVADSPDIAMMLELGVSRGSDVSMLALGLSRTSTVLIRNRVVRDDLTPDECLEWLRENGELLNDLPRAVLSEIRQLVIGSNQSP